MAWWTPPTRWTPPTIRLSEVVEAINAQRADTLPYVAEKLRAFQPWANASFYWTFSIGLGFVVLGGMLVARFDCWEARPNQLLHDQGLWGDVERFPAPGVRLDKEITDVFEYLLIQSGRLIVPELAKQGRRARSSCSTFRRSGRGNT